MNSVPLVQGLFENADVVVDFKIHQCPDGDGCVKAGIIDEVDIIIYKQGILDSILHSSKVLQIDGLEYYAVFQYVAKSNNFDIELNLILPLDRDSEKESLLPSIIFGFFDGTATYTDIIGWRIFNTTSGYDSNILDAYELNDPYDPVEKQTSAKIPFSSWTYRSESYLRDERCVKIWDIIN